jgi:hypothetical protein
VTHVVRIHGAWGRLRDVHEEGLGARVCQSAHGVELLSLLRGSNPLIEPSLACAWPEHGRCLCLASMSPHCCAATWEQCSGFQGLVPLSWLPRSECTLF